MTNQTEPDWIHEGALVAEYRPHNSGGGDAILTTIERLTATQIVLANTKRYNRTTHRRVGNPYGTELLPVTDGRIVDVLACDRLRDVVKTVEKHTQRFRGGRNEVLTTLGLIEAAVVAARRDVADEGGES